MRTCWRAKIISILAHLGVFLIYASVLIMASVFPRLRKIAGLKRVPHPAGKIHVLVTGTFYNEGWLRAHLIPLARAHSISKVWLVCDRPWFPIEKVSYIVPSPVFRRLLGRSLSRVLQVFLTAIRQKPDFLMGYHIMPNSLACLAAASIIGARSAYQMTGGPIQLLGGGPGSENTLLRLLGRESVFLERLVFVTVRHFDLVIVRGQSALSFAKKHNLGKEQIVITAGIDTKVFRPGKGAKEYDLICVSRLVAGKGLEYLIEVIGHGHLLGMKLKVAIVGDGPQKLILEDMLMRHGLGDSVALLGRRDDVHSLLAAARLFILTSPSEGMSIALLEAMATGLPAAITRAGDLGDAVEEGITGIFLDGKDACADASKISRLVEDAVAITRMSAQARHVAKEKYSIESIAQRWDEYLNAKKIKDEVSA